MYGVILKRTRANAERAMIPRRIKRENRGNIEPESNGPGGKRAVRVLQQRLK